MRRVRKVLRLLFTVICAVFVISLIWTRPGNYIGCYREKGPTIPKLQNSEPNGRSIFFIETSCKSQLEGKITINARQACSVESAARANPNLDVFLLYVSSGVYHNDGSRSDKLLDILLSFNNIKIRHIDLDEYFAGTPVENLWTEGIIESSRYIHSHMSDVLRFLTLWKYGGFYFDHDVVHMKSIESFPLNFAAIESEESVASTVLSFSNDENGRSLANICLQDLSRSFDRWQWAYNGPLLATRFGLKICHTQSIAHLYDRTCRNFTFYSPGVFLPVRWQDHRNLFKAEFKQELIEMAFDSFSVHMWNSLNGGDTEIRVDEDHAFNYFAKTYCPTVFNEVDLYF